MEAIDILAVDDDKFVQRVIRKALEPHGFAVRTANDGESGLEQAIEQPPDVILLDVEMPGLSGYQVCEKLAERTEYKHIPIVFLSSHSSLQERMLGYEMGADDYVVKPFEAEDLLARIGVLLKYANQQKELHTQVELANRAAMSALSNTSELGLAMGFMEQSISYNDVTETAEGLLDVLKNLALDGRLMVEQENAKLWYSSMESISPLEKELIEMSDRQQRFHDFGSSTLICFPVACLLITNMPLEDADRYGRIKDLLPLLMSGLSTKVYSLSTQEALKQHTDQLTASVSQIRGSLYRLGTTMLANRKASAEVLQQMIHTLQDDLLRMGLAEDEEEYLIERIDASAEEAIKSMDADAETGAAFSFVHCNLKAVAKEQEALMKAFEEIQEKQEAVSDSTTGDIELF